MRGASADVGAQSRRAALVLIVAVATAAVQITIAARWDGRTPHLTALTMGWAGALWLAWLDRATRYSRPASIAHASVGAVLVAWTWIALLRGRAEYALLNRFLPIAAGLGLVWMMRGARHLRACWRELLLLGFTLMYPLPFAISQLVMPTKLTAASSTALMHLFGFDVHREASLLVFSESSLRVLDACSGLVLMTQMGLLGTLVVCLVPVTVRRAVAVVSVGVAIGFVVNVARITMLGIVASRLPSDFEYWEQYVAGSWLFPLIATGCAGLAWWRILRARREKGDPAAPDALQPT